MAIKPGTPTREEKIASLIRVNYDIDNAKYLRFSNDQQEAEDGSKPKFGYVFEIEKNGYKTHVIIDGEERIESAMRMAGFKKIS